MTVSKYTFPFFETIQVPYLFYWFHEKKVTKTTSPANTTSTTHRKIHEDSNMDRGRGSTTGIGQRYLLR